MEYVYFNNSGNILILKLVFNINLLIFKILNGSLEYIDIKFLGFFLIFLC